MKIRSALLALGIAATLTGCQNMDSNGLLSSGAEAFQGLFAQRRAGENLKRQSLSGDGCESDYRACQQ